MATKTLYLIRGVPGSGKTTLARKLASDLCCCYWEADSWMTDADGNYKFDPKRLDLCHMMCQRQVCRDMSRGMDVIVSNTFIKKREADVYYVLAKVWGYDVKVICCEGNYDNVHGVPQDRVNTMRSNMEPYPNQTFYGGVDNG